MELRRMRDWLERDQLSYWQMQVKRRQEAMMMARTELHRRQIAAQGSDAISDTEQKEALREAQRRLRVAEEKVGTVKRLIPIFHHAMAEYQSHSTPLADHLTGGIEKSLASLEKMVQSLELYLSTAPPTAPRMESEGGSSATQMTSARVGGTAAETGAEGDGASEAATTEETARSEAKSAVRSQVVSEPAPAKSS
jgi:hypothetical protein